MAGDTKCLDIPSLRKMTYEYWTRGRDYDAYLFYIKHLLGRELEYARQHGNLAGKSLNKPLEQPIHTLALTVGESFEPLLQVICVLKPQRVVLILNRQYSDNQSGDSHGKTLRRLIAELSGSTSIPESIRPSISVSEIVCHIIEADTPTEVFRSLRIVMADPHSSPPEGYTNVVDITGAKKSMVVGAFLYAAHTNLPVTYVDFDEYDPSWRRPFGYSCRIGPISNPYEAFRLRDWERVRQRYERYDFRGARELLKGIKDHEELSHGILDAMTRNLEGSSNGKPLFDESDLERVSELVHALELYEAWDSGNFAEAAKYQTKIPPGYLPTVVTELGRDWFEISASSLASGHSEIYADKAKLLVYAYDELQRIGRLIRHNQDYRSAFLRSGALNEVIVIARLMELRMEDPVKVDLLSALQHRTPNAQKLFERLLIQGQKLDLTKIGLSDAPKAEVEVKVPMKAWWKATRYFNEDEGWKKFFKLRNILAHRYVSVSEELANDALQFVCANFEDFAGQTLDRFDYTAASLTWSQLCSICELDFLPPGLRR